MSLSDLLKSKTPAEQRKLLMLALLAVVFVGVLYWRLADAGGQVAAPIRTERTPQPAQGDAALKQIGEAVDRVWPTADLDQVMANNPFRLPAQFTEPETPEPVADEIELAQDDSLVEEEALDQPPDEEPVPFQWPLKVQAVFVDARGAAAMVDSRVVRVGDELQGARVIEIAPGHVTLQRE